MSGLQKPPTHVPPNAHGLSDVHEPKCSGCVHAPPLQTSSVQSLKSSQLIGVPAHAPVAGLHTSPVVHASRSSHPRGMVVGTCVQAVPLQASSVHGLVSAHPAAAHVPPQQICEPVHADTRTHVLPEHDALRMHIDGSGMQFAGVQPPEA